MALEKTAARELVKYCTGQLLRLAMMRIDFKALAGKVSSMLMGNFSRSTKSLSREQVDREPILVKCKTNHMQSFYLKIVDNKN